MAVAALDGYNVTSGKIQPISMKRLRASLDSIR